jgi:hypothetical protein
MHVCRVVLYTKTRPIVSHDDTDNMSTKNRESLFVVLKALDLKSAVYRPCIQGRSMPRPTHQRSLPSGIARHSPRWSSLIHPVERQRELMLTCLSSLVPCVAEAQGSGTKTSALGIPCSNIIIFIETQCTVAPPSSRVTSTATTAAVTVVEPAAEVTTMLGGESVACRFALEEEVVSGVEGVWIDGMGAAETVIGGVSF